MFTDHALRLNLKGIANISIPAGQEVSHEFPIDTKVIVTGAEYFRKGNDEDTISFRIKSNNQVIATLADNIFMGNNNRYEFYQAVLNIGNSIELVYKNNGNEEASFRYNLISHKEK